MSFEISTKICLSVMHMRMVAVQSKYLLQSKCAKYVLKVSLKVSLVLVANKKKCSKKFVAGSEGDQARPNAHV